MPRFGCSAVTLEYTANQTPRVIRKGIKGSASTILKDARRYGIPIVTDNELSDRLEPIYIQEEIPEELYGSVAKYLLRLNLVYPLNY